MRSVLRVLAVGSTAALVAIASACNEAPPTAPSGAGPIPITETFQGTLQPSGEAFYSFSMSTAGPVALTLLSMTGPSVPDDALFPIGIGTPAGTGCTAGVDAAARPGASPQFSAQKTIGVYCVKISDNARLGAPAVFALNITHPR